MLVQSIWSINGPTSMFGPFRMYLMPLVVILQAWDLVVGALSARSSRIPHVSIVRLLAPPLNWFPRSNGWHNTRSIHSTTTEILRIFILLLTPKCSTRERQQHS